MLGELFARGLAVDFELFFWSQHQPAFLHAGGGVGAEFGAVVVVAGHADFEHQFGGAGMFGGVIIDGSADDGEVGFRDGIAAHNGLFGLHVKAGRQDTVEQFEEA